MSKELIIAMIEMGRDGLIRTAQAVPDDKLNWKPLDNGRAVLDLLSEAAWVPEIVTRLLESKGEWKPSYEYFKQGAPERAAWTRDECLEKLRANTDAAIAAIRDVSEEELLQPMKMPIGGEITLPLGIWVMMTYRTFMSRTAQINYIQTLYGDFESH